LPRLQIGEGPRRGEDPKWGLELFADGVGSLPVSATGAMQCRREDARVIAGNIGLPLAVVGEGQGVRRCYPYASVDLPGAAKDVRDV
jgi:hypothetical protein